MGKTIPFPQKKGFQLKISLKNIKPPIWRNFTVQSNILLPDLHKIIQTVMGWTNSHLHHFFIDGRYFPEPNEFGSGNNIDYGSIRLNDVITTVKDKFGYEYDFGDGWDHTIVLEKILDNYNSSFPVCLDGKRACPPEGCGGPYAYKDLIKALSDPEHENHQEITEWLDDDSYDPEYLDIEETNELLMEEDFGCIIF